MSNNIFTKNKLNEIFKDQNSESSIILQNSINIVDTHSKLSNMLQSAHSTTSDFNSSDMPQKGGYLSATSSDMPQKGGYLSATSDISQNKNIDGSGKSMFIPQKGGSFDDNLTSSVVPQKGGSYDDNLTSSVVPQKGGSYDDNLTSSVVPQKGGSVDNNDVNQLISMLTTESNDKNNFTTNSTNTEELENRLRNML